jgi:hypothetical protein
MSIKINDDLMRLEVNSKLIATARRCDGGWWEVTHWPRFFDRNQAITALTVTGLLEAGHSNDEPLIVALREELR